MQGIPLTVDPLQGFFQRLGSVFSYSVEGRLVEAGAVHLPAAFHQVVSLVMRDQGDALVWLMVVGLTVIALTLAHFAGRLARDVSARHGTATWKQVLLCAIPWVALGLAAFAVRLIVADSSGGTTVDGTIIGGDSVGRQARQTSGAVLFLALYVGSGAVAAFGAYFTRNPLRSGYRQAMRAHSRALGRLSRSQPPYERALQVYRQRARIRAREDANYQAARELRLAQADELKRYAAVLIASHFHPRHNGHRVQTRWYADRYSDLDSAESMRAR